VHFCVGRGATLRLDENEAIEFEGFAQAIGAVEHTHDFVVVDTPGTDGYLTRLAHAVADTLITPLNDSFVDFDVLATLDPIRLVVSGEGPYASMVREARRHRRSIDCMRLDWVVVRNRMSLAGACKDDLIGQGLDRLTARLGFRWVDGFAERSVYRSLFPRGLTVLDETDRSLAGPDADVAAVPARAEVARLIDALRLPLDAGGLRRAQARQEWFAAQASPLEMHEFLETYAGRRLPAYFQAIAPARGWGHVRGSERLTPSAKGEHRPWPRTGETALPPR
jgi:chromosome partitioning protein